VKKITLINFSYNKRLTWSNSRFATDVYYSNQTPLHLVSCAGAAGGHPEIIRALLASGSRVNQPDSGQQTALHKAVLAGSPDDVQALLESGADPNCVDNMGHSPVHVAAKRKHTGEWQWQRKRKYKYVYITTNQPDTKCKHNYIPNSNPTTKQYALVNIQLNIVTCPIRFQRNSYWDNVIALFLLLSVVIFTLPKHTRMQNRNLGEKRIHELV